MQEVKSKKLPFGTKEFAESNVNYMTNCELNCLYCYGKIFALRFGRIESPEEWKDMKPNMKVINANYRKRQGKIMFPSAHNITSNNLEYCIIVLKKLLKSGNDVLIVSKPEPDIPCIRNLLKILLPYKSHVEFRFTITSNNNERLKFWEPNASSIEDRLYALFLTYNQGYLTSVNIEPSLDENPITLIKRVAPFSSEIWWGIMNWINWLEKINPTLDQALLTKNIKYIKKISSWTNVQKIVENIRQLPENIKSKIRFKDSIKRIYKKNGLPGEIEKILKIENCFRCKNCIQNKNKNYSCKFKHVNMGKEPYYPVEIPKSAKWSYGSEVCKFEPKTELRNHEKI